MVYKRALLSLFQSEPSAVIGSISKVRHTCTHFYKIIKVHVRVILWTSSLRGECSQADKSWTDLLVVRKFYKQEIHWNIKDKRLRASKKLSEDWMVCGYGRGGCTTSVMQFKWILPPNLCKHYCKSLGFKGNCTGN